MAKFKSIRGMNDVTPKEVAIWLLVEKSIRSVFNSYGYEEIRLPIVEQTELFARSVGDSSDIVSKEMYAFEDRGGDGGPEPILDPTTLEVGTEYAQGDYGMSDLDRIRAGQAKRAMLVQRGIIQDNPIVDESITDITMQANSGGLANLFRVKNQ